jgi:tetratricopeptide (TPR) repeat protein
MGATSVVSGHFQSHDNKLEVMLEALDVVSNRTVWRDTVTAPASDRLTLREKMRSTMQQGLIPALGGTITQKEAGTNPTSEEAYELYLRAIATPHDADGNRQAISLLEKSVAVDPGYATAWEALGLRYLIVSRFDKGGDQKLALSDSSFERALLLDPNLISSAAFLITNRTERGEIGTASAEAVALVKRRPESAEAHFVMAYVLRYAGFLDTAAQECQTAVALDQHNGSFRSCGVTFMELNRPQTAMEFLRLDSASEWSAQIAAYVWVGQGKIDEALRSIRKLSFSRAQANADLFEACFDASKRASLEKLSHQAESIALTQPDPEVRYRLGSLLFRCGEKEAAMRLLRSALEHNYCAYTALQTDPLLEELRRDKEYADLLSTAKGCQDKFATGLKQVHN